MERTAFNLGLIFNNVAKKNQNSNAIIYPSGNSYSYEDLNFNSNRIARFLKTRDIKKRDVIVIFNDKSYHSYASMIACLKIGAIYCNIDISSPFARAEKMINKINPSMILYDNIDKNLLKKIKGKFLLPIINLNSENFKAQCSKESPKQLDEINNVEGTCPAYIMFTSGSTGHPKGVVISHDNVINFIYWSSSTFKIKVDDILTNVNPMYFDNSAFDFYNSIFTGATLGSINDKIAKDPNLLVKTVEKLKCTLWYSVPSLLIYLITARALEKDNFKSIKRFAFAGEGFPKPKLKELYDLYNKRSTLYNCYGPTETTCLCSSYIIEKKDFKNMEVLAPLGFMAYNFRYVIAPLDSENKNYGELYLIGPSVGLGYYNDSEKTNASFIQNPFNSKFNEIAYKSGDIVEKDDKGWLHFRGRVDNQIKHMGYRIELEEIEAALNTISNIDEACVIYKKLDLNMGFIYAFISSKNSVNIEHIKSELKLILPNYMIPKKIFIFDSLPKNANGKIDRNNLKAQI